MPEIDFNRYDLIIGKKQLTQGVESIEFYYSRDCNGAHNLNITVKNNDATEALYITYHALVPKLGAEQTVGVNVEVE